MHFYLFTSFNAHDSGGDGNKRMGKQWTKGSDTHSKKLKTVTITLARK